MYLHYRYCKPNNFRSNVNDRWLWQVSKSSWCPTGYDISVGGEYCFVLTLARQIIPIIILKKSCSTKSLFSLFCQDYSKFDPPVVRDVCIQIRAKCCSCGDIKTKIYLFIFPQSQLLGMMDIVDEITERIKISFDRSED